MNRAIDLRLTVESNILRVIVVNRSESDLRLWDRNNSWGWSMFSLLLGLPLLNQWRELTTNPIRWTANIPRTLNLPIGNQLNYELGHKNPSWEDMGDANSWLSQPLQVRVRLRIIKTPEAVAQDVFIGEALSPPGLSMPPHSWFHSPSRTDQRVKTLGEDLS
jgi:hypothetical protein